MLSAQTKAPAEALRIAVAICSTGRSEHLRETVLWLSRQVQRPSQVVMIVTQPADLPEGLSDIDGLPLEIVFSPKGLTKQRNRALEALDQRCDVIFFIDDDYLANKWALAALNRTFLEMPQVSGITGHLIADGINSGGINVEIAKSLLVQTEGDGLSRSPSVTDRRRRGLYGCNMAFRMAAVGQTRFDENLPRYGWQEDVDFSNRVDGKNIRLDSLIGVHCGTSSGRETQGTALGYSQIANPLYLSKKGSLNRRHAARLIFGNLAANIWGLAKRETRKMRILRFLGNLSAFRDGVQGKLHPLQIDKKRDV